jgi:hypothetical protein
MIMKKIYLKKTGLFLSLAILITSCQNDDFNQSNPNAVIETTEIKFESINFDENGKLKLKFAQAFSNALVANKDVRRLVKEEALKKFNKDYDVLYALVKNESLTPTEYLKKGDTKTSKILLQKSANALTLREALLPFFSSEAELIEIEQKMPLLTIFVPELPLGAFSAETWDVNDETQIPDVALRLNNTDDIPVIGKDGEKYVIEAELTPGYPIVVIKENERVRLKKSSSKQNSKTALIDAQFEYVDDNFDPGMWVPTPIINNNGLDQFLIDGYNVWQGDPSVGWQRDNIYYGLTPTKLKGPLNGGKYREYITSFKMQGDAQGAFTTIANIEDPQRTTDYRVNTSSGWTDGQFEFMIYCFYGSKVSNIGDSEKKGFFAKPSDLFELSYSSYSRGTWPFRRAYIRTTIVALKTINFLNNNYGTVLEFQTWDLNRFSNEWKFSFEEVDDPLEITNKQTISSKFNANFSTELSGSIFEVVKVGVKYGASIEESKSNEYTVKKTTKSNNLFDAVVPFYDNVVNRNPNTGQLATRSYYTGKVEFQLRPIQVQW